MPAPFVHIDQRLTDYSVRYPAEQPMVRGFFFPPKMTDHLSNLITKWNRANILRIDDLDMAGADEELPGLVELVLDANDRYSCNIWAARAADKKITAMNADPAVDYEVERALMAKQRLDTLLEYKAIKGTLRDSSTMSGAFETCPAAEQFDNDGSADNQPITKLGTIVLTIETQTGGHKPNVCAMSPFTLQAIALSEQYKDLSKFSKIVVADKDSSDGRARILEDLIGLPSGAIHLTSAMYNTAKAGAAESLKQFIGSSVIMAYVTPPSIRTQGFGVGFVWGGYGADPLTVIKVPQLTSGLIPGEEIRCFSIVDFKPTNVVAGYCLDQAVDPTKTGNGFLD